MVLAVLDKYEFERIAETHEDVVHSMFWRMKHVLNIASVPPLLASYRKRYGAGELEAAFIANCVQF